MDTTVLIVEDDNALQTYLKDMLSEHNYNVITASDGMEAMEKVETYKPDLTVLDLGLPTMSGESVCRQMRKKYPDSNIIILTAKDTADDIVQGLELGADDYMTKPFMADELVARINARLRRAQDTTNGKKRVGDLIFDTSSLEVQRAEKKITLTAQELKLLEYFMDNKGRVLTRDMILNKIWMYPHNVETRVVDVYVGYLRKKIDHGYDKKLIQSVRGFGYVMKD
jgi:DNA-binding response OmpR family regulator